MPSYHCSVKSISRSAGRSATAAAAYRSGSAIVDLRTGEIHDYTRKQGVLYSEIVLPDGAPEWARERAQLWNAAEASENRKNSQVAREFEIALPSELSAEGRQKLAIDFARELTERHGVAADVCIHAPARGGEDKNYHAHILLSTRRMTQDGMGEKTREFDVKPSSSELVTSWRARWEAMQNEALEKAGVAERVDCRTLEAQGIDRVPQVHLGVAAVEMDERGVESDRMRRWNDVEDMNHDIRRASYEYDRQIEIGERRSQSLGRSARPDPADSRDVERIGQPIADGQSASSQPVPKRSATVKPDTGLAREQSTGIGQNAPNGAAGRRIDKNHAGANQDLKKPASAPATPSTGQERDGDAFHSRMDSRPDGGLDGGLGMGARHAGADDERSRDSAHQQSRGRGGEGATSTTAAAPMNEAQLTEAWETLKEVAGAVLSQPETLHEVRAMREVLAAREKRFAEMEAHYAEERQLTCRWLAENLKVIYGALREWGDDHVKYEADRETWLEDQRRAKEWQDLCEAADAARAHRRERDEPERDDGLSM